MWKRFFGAQTRRRSDGKGIDVVVASSSSLQTRPPIASCQLGAPQFWPSPSLHAPGSKLPKRCLQRIPCCLPCLVRLQSTGFASNIQEFLVFYGFLKFLQSVLWILLGEPKSHSFAQAAPSCPRFPAFSGPTAAPRSCPVRG